MGGSQDPPCLALIQPFYDPPPPCPSAVRDGRSAILWDTPPKKKRRAERSGITRTPIPTAPRSSVNTPHSYSGQHKPTLLSGPPLMDSCSGKGISPVL